MRVSARDMEFRKLNQQIKSTPEDVYIEECYGQRFLASGLAGTKQVTIQGTPGNALGAYLDGATLVVEGNAQDAVGDTMNGGKIIIHGNAGDELGYAMRDGRILVKGNAGYRTGIHMKEYREKKPVIVVGGQVGSFLGEYLAGGVIVVLGLDAKEVPVGNFTGTGMHGGKIFIRTEQELKGLPAQVTAELAGANELAEIVPYVQEFAACFEMEAEVILNSRFYRLTPNAKNPYRQLYTAY